MSEITKESAWQLVKQRCDFALQRHLAFVATAMEAMAKKLGHPEQAGLWYVCGLLHDIDWNDTINHPADHCGEETISFLHENGASEAVCRVIKSHCPWLNIPRDDDLKKTLFAVDELSGFIVAVALVRPTKMIGINANSVVKKMKSKSFAAQVNREDMKVCTEYFDIELKEFINILLPEFEKLAADWQLVG